MALGGVHKVRRRLLAKGGMKVGSNGTTINKILAGTVSACVPVVNASAVGTGSMLIPDAEAGDRVILSGSQGSAGIGVYAAIATAACSVTACYFNPTGTNSSASTLTFSYILMKPA